MADPDTQMPEFTSRSVGIFLIAVADGLLDAQEHYPQFDVDRWAIEIENALTPPPRQNPRLTMDDLASLGRVFESFREILASRRQRS